MMWQKALRHLGLHVEATPLGLLLAGWLRMVAAKCPWRHADPSMQLHGRNCLVPAGGLPAG